MADALMVTSSFLPGHGGIETYLDELCGIVAPRVAVMAAGRRDGKPLPHDLSYDTIAGPGSMLVPRRKVARAVVQQCSALGTDRVLFGTPWPLVLIGPQLVRAGLRYGVIVHGAELLVPAAVPGLRRLLAGALAGAEVLFPVSDFTAGALRGVLTRAGREVPPLQRLYARVDLDRFTPDVDTTIVDDELGLDEGAEVVLCLGRLVERKGVDRLIRAMPAIVSRRPRAVLVVAGTGPQERRLRRLAADTPAPVIFAGRVPDEHTPAYYARAEVFALPVVDRYRGLEVEGLGVVLLEAAACGTACVTGRSGGTPEAVVDGVTGHVVDARSPEHLTEAIVALLADPGRAAAMGAAGRAHVAEHFSAAEAPEALLEWLR